jgi:adenylate cyclase
MPGLPQEERIAVEEAVGEGLAGHPSLERERFELLYQVGRRVLEASSADDLNELALSLVFDSVNAERGALLLRDSDGAMRASTLRHRDHSELSEDELRVPSSIVNEAVSGAVGILTTDALHDPRFLSRASVQEENIRSAICVPLWDGAKVLGVIYLDSQLESYAFTRDDLLLLSSIANLVAIRLKQESLNAELSMERVVRSNLERYHSPDVAEAILTGARDHGEAGLGLEEREVTIVFADLTAFTPLAETMAPAGVADLLDDFYGLATRIVFENGGSVNEFVGDAVMAIFGAPVSQPDHADRAVRAAIQLQQALRKRRAEATESREHIEVRIAINSGSVVAGTVGPPHRLKYAVIGDAVNVAARLEALAEPGSITLGEATYHQLREPPPSTDLGETQLRGREQSIRVYRVAY